MTANIFWVHPVLGAIVTRIVTSAQMSDQFMPGAFKEGLGEAFQLSVARSQNLQKHWLLSRMHYAVWRVNMACRRQVLIKRGEYMVIRCPLQNLTGPYQHLEAQYHSQHANAGCSGISCVCSQVPAFLTVSWLQSRFLQQVSKQDYFSGESMTHCLVCFFSQLLEHTTASSWILLSALAMCNPSCSPC